MAKLAWMLDTNIVSALIKNPAGPVRDRLAAVPPETVCTSIVVACELRFGALKRGSVPLQNRVDALLSNLTVLALDGEADRHYAEIRLLLEKAGTPIGSHDLFIAAHARSAGLTLVTHNLREFKRVPGLAVESWLDGF
jgi:tRNA(fMet)-specific endonuclease VapC